MLPDPPRRCLQRLFPICDILALDLGPVSTEQFQVLAAGQSSTEIPLFEHASMVNRFQVQSRAIGPELISDILSGPETRIPDLILIDADSEEPTGLDICRQLKEHPNTMMLPVVVVSRNSATRMPAYAAGADDFVLRADADDLLYARLSALARAGASRRRVAAEARNAELQRGQQLHATFRRYVSPQLADRILGDGAGLPAITDMRTRAVVLFADLRGFTAFSERLEPHEVVPLLNEYFSLLTEITFHNEGTVFHMAGDCLMVGWGVPFMQTDATCRAVNTGRQMLERFAVLADDWQERHGIETGLGIGINEGAVVAGNIGSPSFMSYTIIGDAVNIASRLCQRARAGEMVLTSAVKRSLDERGQELTAVELPAMTLRGRSSPIDLWCVPAIQRLQIVQDAQVL